MTKTKKEIDQLDIFVDGFENRQCNLNKLFILLVYTFYECNCLTLVFYNGLTTRSCGKTQFMTKKKLFKIM